MSHLLHVTRLPSKAVQRKGVMPLMLEFQVPAETAPYLVSSSSSVLWINDAHPGSLVKAAVRESTPGAFFREVVEAVIAMGRQQEWGNVHPLTIEGLRAAIDHVAFYELGPLELLTPRAHPAGSTVDDDDEDETAPGDVAAEAPQRVSSAALMPPGLRPLLEEAGLPFRPSAWVPSGTVVVVPRDRSFVGMVSQVTPKKIAGVVHNAARGIGIAQGSPPHELADRTLPDPGAG